jgi:16S rRNA (uracil1498-N3)-methyltransferase
VSELKEGQALLLAQEAANHLTRVLRLRVNDPLILFNGHGGEFAAVISAVAKNNVTVQVGRFFAKEVESPLFLHLGQGISRGEKMDFTIQKAVELGVKQISPLIMARCGVKLSAERWDKKLQHWRAVAIAACEQSGRNQLPDIFEPMPLMTWLTELKADLKLLCSPAASTSLSAYAGEFKTIAMLIGPESGLDEQEFTLAKQYGCLPLTIGPRILRTETAALAVITAVQVRFGDMA